MQCPKCGATIAQRDAVECPYCGVVLAKAVSRYSRGQYEHLRAQTPLPAPTSTGSSIPFSRILVVAAVIAVGWWLVQRRNGSVAAAEWYSGASGFERAVAEQREAKKPVLLYFHADWCGYCKQLERDVLNTSKFNRRYASMIKVKVNPQEGQRERELAESYGIRGFPTVFVLPPSGGRQTIEGYGGSGEFYSQLDNALR